MSYSVCYDSLRYPVAPEGCDVVEEERARFKETGHPYVGSRRRRPRVVKRRSGGRVAGNGRGTSTSFRSSRGLNL